MTQTHFYILERYGVRSAQLFLCCTAPLVYLFLVVFGLGDTALLLATPSRLAYFTLSMSVLALFLWSRQLRRAIRQVRAYGQATQSLSR